jgi:hypothetical protein
MALSSMRSSAEWSRAASRDLPLAIGGALWLVGLIILPASLAARITLAAPLVLVPLLLARHPAGSWTAALGGWVALVTAVPLTAALALPAGPAAGAATLPWLGLCLAAAGLAARHGLPQLPTLLHPDRADALGAHISLGFLAVGGTFLAFDRLGLRPLGFSPEIILLTATHFHFAAFGLLTVTTRLARRSRALKAAALGLVLGFPITAAGFTIPSDALNALGATVVGLAALTAAAALIGRGGRGWRAWSMRGAGIALLIGMPLGIAWSWALWLGFAFMDLGLMVRTHGILMAAAVLLAAFATPESDR